MTIACCQNRGPLTERVLLAAVLALICVAAVAAPLSEQEQRGKSIYVGGKSVSGTPITALVSRGGTPITASILPCVGCHGDDGKGRPEGGVVPSDVTWPRLTASYGHDHSYGRSHAAFDETSLARSIILGMDPAGNTLDTAMPRYQMSQADMLDLVAYMKRIEDDLDPGLTEDTIRIGTLLPMAGSLQNLGQVMRQVLDAYLADVNAGGGIHGRTIELVVAETKADPVESGWQARDLLDQKQVFAIVSGYTAGIENQIAELAEEFEVPVVGPYTQLPQEGDGLERHSFYLIGGVIQQGAVLARHSRSDGSRRIAVVRPQGKVYDTALERVEAELEARGASVETSLIYQSRVFDVTDTATTLSSRSIDTVLFFGQASDLKRLANAASAVDWQPDLLLPGVFAGKDMFEIAEQFGGRVLVAYSTMPSDHTPRGVAAFEKLHSDHDIDYRYSAAQISAYVAAAVLVEGLKRAGKALSREKLLAALEGLAGFQAGLMPPISYNHSRRIGAHGGYVVPLDLGKRTFGEASNWISLQP